MAQVKVYIEPGSHFISRSDETEKLYRLEEKRNVAIKDCATEWAKINAVPQEEFWTQSLPQALFDLLQSFDSKAAEMAALAYLKANNRLPDSRGL